MAHRDAVRAAKRGTDSLQRWYEASNEEFLDLSGADLRWVNLRWFNFAGANLEGTRFDHAKLTGAYFGPSTFQQVAPYVDRSDVPVRLAGASFRDANLLASTFNYPLICGANFDGAYLGLANFRMAVFENTFFAGARLLNTSFSHCDLSDAVGLDSIEHLGPSHIDFGTLSLSKNLTPRFLRQIGLSVDMSNRLETLVSSATPDTLYSCFLSHSSADKAFCDRLYARLVDERLRVWYAPEEMRGGELISKQLLQAVQQHDRALVVLSESSLKSNWVGNELRWALKREEATKAQVLFPISLVPFSRLQNWELIDPDTGIDIAARIRGYFLPDFSNWDNALSFEAAFANLLKSLKPNNTIGASRTSG